MTDSLAHSLLPTGQRFEVAQADLTRETTDAIVNAANSRLLHGGGVAGAIVRAGGYDIQRESDAWVSEHGPVAHAAPAYTGAGSLPSRYVIHAVGPVWGEGDEDSKLASAVMGSLRVADQLGLRSISLPLISSGIFGFPKDRAARLFMETIPAYFTANPGSGLQLVRLVAIDRGTVEVMLAAFRSAFFDTQSL